MQERVKAGVLQARTWIDEAGGDLPPGNSGEAHLWAPPEQPSDVEVDGGAASGGVMVSPFSRATVCLPTHLCCAPRVHCFGLFLQACIVFSGT